MLVPGSTHIVKLREEKRKHLWSLQVMEALLKDASTYRYENNGRGPNLLPIQNEGTATYALMDGSTVHFSEDMELQVPAAAPSSSADCRNINNPRTTISNMKSENVFEMETKEMPLLIETKNGVTKESIVLHCSNISYPSTTSNMKSENRLEMEKKETPLLIAAKNGVTEMVEGILRQFPVAVYDMNSENKKVVLLAVENRQPDVYNVLLKLEDAFRETIFRKRDNEGNSALHLAAKLGEHRPWLIPGAALQMQWEIKWYEFVKNSIPHNFFTRFNRKGETPRNIFTKTHSTLVKEGGQWLTNTSQSCSVVAALIATVAFATSATVPGGVKSESGIPTLADKPAFSIFAIASLVALCFSVTSVVMFLAILTSRYQEKDFGMDLPRKLLLGLTSLFVSIASMLVSFCAGHFFELKDKLQYAASPVYAVTCLPVTFFAVAQFPLYFDLAWATIKKVPQRSYK